MSEIASLRELVGRVLERLEGGSVAAFQEPIRRGSATGWISFVEDPDEEGRYLLQVRLRIMRVPEEGTFDVFRRLLELNHAFRGRASFSVDDGLVSLTAARPVSGLDASEVIDLLLWTSEQADHYDDVLLGEFGYQHAL